MNDEWITGKGIMRLGLLAFSFCFVRRRPLFKEMWLPVIFPRLA
jgi:hypothetical protein